MTLRKNVLFPLAALSLISLMLPGCGGKSNDEAATPAKDGAVNSREGGDTATSPATPGTSATPGASGAPTGSLANPQPPEGSTK